MAEVVCKRKLRCPNDDADKERLISEEEHNINNLVLIIKQNYKSQKLLMIILNILLGNL